MSTFDGSMDCEVCKSENSFIFRGDTRDDSKYGYCLDCGVGEVGTSKKDSTFYWDLETINKYREYEENHRFENWKFEKELGVISDDSKYEPKWTPLKKLVNQ